MLAPAHLLAATSFLIGSASAQEALIAAPAITSKRKWMTSAQQTIAQHKRQATGADGIGGNATTQDQAERTAAGSTMKARLASEGEPLATYRGIRDGADITPR
jgi:type IV secretory pathway TrbL component